MVLPITRIYTQYNQYWEDYKGFGLYSTPKLVRWINETVSVSDQVSGFMVRHEKAARTKKG